uniref:Transmembrane protein 198 n=1 Tax=Hyaloperonospora arabidopsidis (strain Emoy2) TaxID=559515 RepID=M4BBZ3_HYAAE
MLVGLIVCLAGYRLFRPTVFCSAFVVGGLFLAGIIETAFASLDWMPTASWIGFAVGGLIAGVAVLFLYSASIFLGGAAGGVMLAFTLNTSVGTKIIPSNPDILLVILALLLGILGGILALKLEKPVLITATAIVGATVCVSGVGYFAGDYPNGADLKAFGKKNDDGNWVYHIPDAWWGYLGAMAVLFMLGMSAQIGKTARGYDHGGQRESHGIKKNPDHAAV